MSAQDHDWVFQGRVNPNTHAIRWTCSKCDLSRIQLDAPDERSKFDDQFDITCDVLVAAKVMEG